MSDDFFPTPRAPEKPEPRPPSPPWSGPPYGTLPGALALEIVLGQSATAAVYLGRCAAYPTGLDFELHVIASAEAGDELDPSLNGIYHRPGRASSYEGMLRFGVAFADGRKASNLGGHAPTDEQPDGPVLWGMGGGGGGGRWHQGFWMWPLPPAGPLAFVCEWPAAGIAQTRVEVDSERVREAAGRARALFPDRDSGVPGGTWSRSVMSSAPAEKQDD